MTTMKKYMSKLISQGLYIEALKHYKHLHSNSSISCDLNFTFPLLLKACTKLKATTQVQILHSQITKLALQTHTQTASALMHAYVKLSISLNTLQLFDEMPEPNIELFNAAISGFSQNGFLKESFGVFSLACVRNVRPDSVSVVSVLSKCGDMKNGVGMHCFAIKIGLECDLYSATSILSMYLNCGDMVSATKLFELVENKNVVCYNAYMSGLLKNGVYSMVLRVFREMVSFSNEKPNMVTIITVCSACAKLSHLLYGQQVHGIIVKRELRFDVKVGTTLVDMYSKCGSWRCAYEVFMELGDSRNLVAWIAMITCMIENGQSEHAVELFSRMEIEAMVLDSSTWNPMPDSSTWNPMISVLLHLRKEAEALMLVRKLTYSGVKLGLKSITSLLSACSGLVEVRSGKEIHGYVFRIGAYGDDFIATALIDMYMKCGQCNFARHVFDQVGRKPDDPVFWNAMISGYGRNGESEAAFDVFLQMRKENVQPDATTFSCILMVCSHADQINRGWEILRSMIVDHKLNPTAEHLNVMVDLLGRHGWLEEAQGLLREIPKPSVSVFSSLLGACRNYTDSKLGEELAKRIFELQPENPTPYIILSNIYAEHGKWENVKRLREAMEEQTVKKLRGHSLIGIT
ncbi:hypothetical protein LIER_15754 [Lithospermum erythrorhizon]|uniref:Pentatricopeptide repeat-containing protein n=1 Tax=Lithospermum erythrorhizon TaxID=34254 RepID=A0AAV3Q788_LITER